MNKEQVTDILGRIDDQYITEALETEAKKQRPRAYLWRVAAACLALAIVASVSVTAVVAEAKEYEAAVAFFTEYGLSTDGLTRGEIKAVYRDITTQRFTNEKTAQVLRQAVPGWEIEQEVPTPEEMANCWNTNVWNRAWAKTGLHYEWDYCEEMDDDLGFTVLSKSTLSCYRDEELLWTVDFDGVFGEGCLHTDSGTLAWGKNYRWASSQSQYAVLARLDDSGKTLWKIRLNHGFKDEWVTAVLDNGDGTFAVVSMGDYHTLCLSQYDLKGNKLSSQKTEIGTTVGVRNAARLGDGYLVQLYSAIEQQTARLMKLDHDGNAQDEFTYEGADCEYAITDMIEFGGRLYLSAYAYPKPTDDYGRYEIGNILNYVFDKYKDMDISSEELTPMVRDNYTAVLLLCDPEGGAPKTFYSVKGSLGGSLALNAAGQMTWEVEAVQSTFFSPATSSFTIGGTCEIFRYTFDPAGNLLKQEDTGETTGYHR